MIKAYDDILLADIDRLHCVSKHHHSVTYIEMEELPPTIYSFAYTSTMEMA